MQRSMGEGNPRPQAYRTTPQRRSRRHGGPQLYVAHVAQEWCSFFCIHRHFSESNELAAKNLSRPLSLDGRLLVRRMEVKVALLFCGCVFAVKKENSVNRGAKENSGKQIPGGQNATPPLPESCQGGGMGSFQVVPL